MCYFPFSPGQQLIREWPTQAASITVYETIPGRLITFTDGSALEYRPGHGGWWYFCASGPLFGQPALLQRTMFGDVATYRLAKPTPWRAWCGRLRRLWHRFTDDFDHTPDTYFTV